MTTQAQIDANRRNAEKSTGPQTQEGKARVARNAARHGLCADIALMAGEEELEQDFKQLLAERLNKNQQEYNFDQTKQVSLMLSYHTTADRAFNKNLADLRKLQKERQKEEIGFVSQKAPQALHEPRKEAA